MASNVNAYEATLVDGQLAGSAKWRGGVLAADGNIYGIPFSATQVLRFDPRTQQATLVGAELPGGGKWRGGVLAADGSIYGIPSKATQVLRFKVPGSLFGFLSHTQRDPEAKLLASELWAELSKKHGLESWLDVKMPARDTSAMEAGVRESDCFIAIITDDGKNSYFSREMCRQEVRWAEQYGKPVIAVVQAEDKGKIGGLILEAKSHGLDFSRIDFCTYDRTGPNQVDLLSRRAC